MRTFILIVALLTSSLSPALSANGQRPTPSPKCAVSYSFVGADRFGDRLLTYLHAKWIAYYYKMPLLYRPFMYSTRLVLDDAEIPWTQERINAFDHIVDFTHWNDLKTRMQPGKRLYIVPFFPEWFNFITSPARRRLYFSAQWDDPGFKAEIRRLVAPKVPTKKLQLPADKITVAVHVRTGGNYDSRRIKGRLPLKFPSHAYYIQQIKKIDELLDHQPLYVHIFTDSLRPQNIVTAYSNALADYPNIQVGGHTPQQQKTFDLIDDFFALTQFDCLIRAQSGFSTAASKLHDYLIEITPISCRRIKGQNCVNDCQITDRREKKIKQTAKVTDSKEEQAEVEKAQETKVEECETEKEAEAEAEAEEEAEAENAEVEEVQEMVTA